MGRPKGSKNKPKVAPAVAVEAAPISPAPVIEAPAAPPVAVAPVIMTPTAAGVVVPVKRRGRPPKDATGVVTVRQSKPKEIASLPGTKPGLSGNWTNTVAAIQAKAAPPAINEALVNNINLMTQEDTPKKYPAEWAEFRRRANRDRQLIKFLAELDTDQLIFAHECMDSYPETVPSDMTAALTYLLEEVTGKLLEIKENK